MYFSFNSATLPHISFMNRHITPTHWKHPRRTPSEYVFFLVTSGEMYLQENEVQYVLKPGDYVFLEPFRTHFGYRLSQCEYFYIHFQSSCLISWDQKETPQLLNQIIENNKKALHVDPFGSALYHECRLFVPKDGHIHTNSVLQEITLHMNQAAHLAEQQIPHYKLSCSARFIEILILLSCEFVSHILPEHRSKIQPEQAHKVQAVISYIQLHYAEQITSEEIAGQFRMNFDSLNRLFKKETGLTVFRYLHQVRLNHARELLTTTHLTLREISEQTGFCDQYYFSRAFRQAYGITPGKYVHGSESHQTRCEDQKQNKQACLSSPSPHS